MRTPYGLFRALYGEISRVNAMEQRDAVTAVHSGNPAWLAERYSAMARLQLPPEYYEPDEATAVSEWDRMKALIDGAHR